MPILVGSPNFLVIIIYKLINVAASLPLLFIDGVKFHQLNFWFALFPGATACIFLCLMVSAHLSHSTWIFTFNFFYPCCLWLITENCRNSKFPPFSISFSSNNRTPFKRILQLPWMGIPQSFWISCVCLLGLQQEVVSYLKQKLKFWRAPQPHQSSGKLFNTAIV